VNAPEIHENHLPYISRLECRPLELIDLVVIHCTELPDLVMARQYGQRIRYPDSGTGNSGHFYIDRTGRIEQWVPRHRVAHHVRGFNGRSLGIELDNNGRYPDWFESRSQIMTEGYTLPQINSLVSLLLRQSAELPNLEWIAGHESLDTSQVQASDNPDLLVKRKTDPGPLFPWKDLLRHIGLERFFHEQGS
jgi:N-acetylmuramoyl-L-alanine amidase